LDESTTVISDLKITLENSEKDLQNAGFGGDVESLQKEFKNLLENYDKKIKLTEDYKKQHEQLLEKVDIMEKKGEEEKKKKKAEESSPFSNLWKVEEKRMCSILRVIDILLVLDLTGSMGSWIEASKEKFIEILNNFQNNHSKTHDLRVAFIGYRDVNDVHKLVVNDFTDNFEQVKNLITEQKPEGGGDEPEDIASALKAAIKLKWYGATRLMIHIGDAPSHGLKYHANDMDDDYPDLGDEIESLVEILAVAKRVDYFFSRIKDTTDKMTTVFKEIYLRVGSKRKFVLKEVGKNVDNFTPFIVTSVTDSMLNSGTNYLKEDFFIELLKKQKEKGVI